MTFAAVALLLLISHTFSSVLAQAPLPAAPDTGEDDYDYCLKQELSEEEPSEVRG